MRVCNLLLVAGLILGCGGTYQPVNRSPTVATDSLEFREAAANAEQIAKEQKAAERKALGRRTIEETEEVKR